MTKHRRSDHLRRYKPPDYHLWVTLDQIAKEIDRTPAQTRKSLQKLGYIPMQTQVRDGRITTYDARSLEVIKALYGIPHRDVMDDVDDWLSRFVVDQPKEEKHDE